MTNFIAFARLAAAVLAGLTTASARPAVPTCAPCIDVVPRLVAAADGTASALLQICNRGTEPLRLALALSDFVAAGAAQETFPLSTTRRVVAVNAADNGVVDGTADLSPRCFPARLEVSGLWQAGLMTAVLMDGPDKMADVQAVRLHAPFSLKVDGPNPDKVELRFVDGAPLELRLRNDDAMGYRFRWRLELPGRSVSGADYVRPNRSVVLRVPVMASGSGVSWLESGFLRSAAREGRLVVEYEPDPRLESYAWSQKSFPVQAAITRYDPVLQSLVNSLWIVLLLLIGIGASLLINYALPMQRRRVAAKQRLAQLEGRLAGLGELVPARLLSLLRVEKRRLGEELRQLWPVDPTTEAALPKFEAQMDWIERRIVLAASAGNHLSALDGSAPLAVFEADQIREACDIVFEVIDRPQAGDDDVKRAQTALERAANLRVSAALPPTEQMLKDLGQRAAAVRSRLTPVVDPDPQAAFNTLVDGLLMDVPVGAPAALSVSDYAVQALAVAKAEVVADFRRLLAAARQPELLARRQARTVELLAALCPGPDESLRRARGIVQEAEQGVSEDDLVAVLGNIAPADLRIDVDPPRPLPYQPVSLRVRLRQPGLDDAVARCRIDCVWSVTGGEIESDDWVASYYFEQPPREPGWSRRRLARLMKRELPAPKAIQVHASLRHRGVELAQVTPVTVQIEPPKSYAWTSTWLSLGAMFVTMLLVGVGLLAGAQEKIQSLDWVAGVFAVLALGFGADALKRVLMRP